MFRATAGVYRHSVMYAWLVMVLSFTSASTLRSSALPDGMFDSSHSAVMSCAAVALGSSLAGEAQATARSERERPKRDKRGKFMRAAYQRPREAATQRNWN